PRLFARSTTCGPAGSSTRRPIVPPLILTSFMVVGSLRDGTPLALQQLTLALGAPGVAGEHPVMANHAVTGNGDGEMVGGAGAGDGARSPRGADAPRDLRIGNRPARGNLP